MYSGPVPKHYYFYFWSKKVAHNLENFCHFLRSKILLRKMIMDISILFRNNWANIDSWHWSSKIGEFWNFHYWILRRHPMAQLVVIWRKKWLIRDYHFIPIFVVWFHLFSQTFNLWHLRAIVQHFWSANSLV